MGLRSAVLIFLLVAALPEVAAAAAVGCLRCHPTHYGSRGACVACHGGDPRSDRLEIAHDELIPARFSWFALPGSPVTEQGNRLLDRSGCRRCHVSGGKGNRLAADLDRLFPPARPEEVLAAIRQPVLFMPDFVFSEPAAVTLVNALLANSARTPRPAGEAPLVVHFEGGERQENAFDKHCGGCHRALTRTWGGIGRGAIGPNLSGLFTGFYPHPFREGEPWTAERLKKWLENPRAVRPQARMRPVVLEGEELKKVLEIVAPGAPP